ncbi:unnamed protein product [Peronospora belbahrii]|uniref:HEAT repeat-containing protein 1 n=1 Tax=Peronospora belbahrii TaxID=622444 RepID=A0AAU9KYX4_9STRA|nr:unnamed protein product [Peronospora belbahrii]
MTSALAKQLQQLREAGAGSKRRTSTFLYDEREAAEFDDETIYNLAWNGLLELKQRDARFEALEMDEAIGKLFTRERLHFYRTQTRKQDEKELDQALETILDALSASFLLHPAHKVLEFLVRRYEIHHYNVDSIMAMIIPYHESKWFIRMVRILHIHDTRWEFLRQVKTQGTKLVRAALVQRAMDESSIIEFLYKAATRIGPSNPKLTSLYTLIVLQVLENAKVTEQMLRWLVPQLLTALKCRTFPELQSSAYMIVTKLASKATLSANVVDALVKVLLKFAQSGAQMNALLCVIFLAHTQPSFRLSATTGKHLVLMENLGDFLRDATSNYESARFVQLLTVFLTQNMESMDDDCFRLFTVLVESVSVVDGFTDKLVEMMVKQAGELAFAMDNTRVQAISKGLVVLGKKNATQVDVVISSLLSKQTKKSEEDNKLNKFLTATFKNVTNSAHFVPSNTNANTSLALALDHPTEHIRYEALVLLAKMNDVNAEATTTNKVQVLTSGDVLLRRMLDDSKRIATFMISSSLGDLMLSLSSKKQMLKVLVQTIRKWFYRGEASIVEAVADFMLKSFRKTAASLDTDEKLLTLFVSLVNTKEVVTVDTVWAWIAVLDHPFGVSASKSSTKSGKGVTDMAEDFGHALSANVSELLPYCLCWSRTSEFNENPLTGFLIDVLSVASAQLAATKSKKTQAHLVLLEQSYRLILKKEFVMLCEDGVLDEDLTRIIRVASKLAEVAYAVFAVSCDDFDDCVTTLLQSPTPIFIRSQQCLLELFHGDLSNQLLPTMARIVTKPASTNDLLEVLAKTRALDIISAVLEGFSYAESEVELRQLVHAVPVVMVALSDLSKAVRQSALTCLDRWVVSCGATVRSSKLADLKVLQTASAFLLHAKQDILMDANSVVALSGLFCAQKESLLFHQVLMNFVSSASISEMCIAAKLFDLLAPVKDTSFWLQSVDFFQQTLAGCLTTGADKFTLKLLIGFLTHYLDPNVAVTTRQGKSAVSKEFAVAMISVLRTEKDHHSRLQKLQVFLASNLSADVYKALDDVSRYVLVDKLLRLLMVAEESVASKLIQCLNTLPISYGIFVQLLEKQFACEVEFSELSCILEVLVIKVDSVSSDEEAAVDVNKLLTALCNVLALFCDPKHESSVSEYILQVLFSCLRRICEVTSSSFEQINGRLAKSTKHVTTTVKPQLLVKHTLTCLGRTSSPQTRNECLLFISSLVNLHPSSVLASLDKILSFVSSGSIRHEDEYSFHVLETIIRAVVPHIVANQEAGTLMTPQRFLGLFVDAFDQIPRSKREVLFKMVVGVLGCELLPYCVVALLQHAAVVEDMDSQRERIQFAHSMCFNFECSDQVSSLVMVLRITRDLLPHVVKEAETDTDEIEEDDDKDDVQYERFVFGERLVKSSALSRRLNSILLKFIATHLRARELHHKILSYQSNRDRTNDEDSRGDVLQHNYLVLAQLDLLYFRRVAREQSLHDDESGFWTALATDSMDILGALQQLLSSPGFIAVISELLHHDNSLVRKKAMQLFNERLQEERDSLSPGEALLFIDMLDELDAILQNPEGSENSVNIQTALLSVDILARNFAANHTKRFQQILPTIVKYVDRDVINFFHDAALVWFGTKAVLQCLLAALEVFTDKIPQFLGPYLPRVIRSLLTPALLSSAPTNVEVLMSVDCCFLNLSNHVELRQLLPTLFDAYEHVLALKSDMSVTRLFSVVGTVVNELDSSAIRKHLPTFARFFVTALDARRVHASKLEDLDNVEDDVLECLVQFILKLSEKQLKPLFLKLVEWTQTRVGSSGKIGDISRRISFFKLVVKLSKRLRGIFVPYYAHVLEFLALSLAESRKVLMQKPRRSPEDSESDDDFFASADEPPVKKAKGATLSTLADTKAKHERNTLLLTTVVRALDGCFVHDNDGFIEKDQFNIVMTPLVDVLDVLQYENALMRDFILETVAPCLANLAWAAKSDLLWKPLHYAVLMKSRGESAAVRLGALVTIEKCYQVIGEEFLVMLPESIPFLAELMEDTNTEVEKTCHRVIKQIEEISGESLDQYLTT